jgi:hypothetical protein
MRVASRIVGVVLALAGLVFLGLSVLLLFTFHPESVLEGPGLGRRMTSALPAVVFGGGFILAGWYFIRLDVDRLDEVDDQPASRFARYLLAHRRELKFIAQAGLVISVIRVVAAWSRTRLAMAMGGVAPRCRMDWLARYRKADCRA